MLFSLVFFVHADELSVSRNVRASLLLRSEQHGGGLAPLGPLLDEQSDATAAGAKEDEEEEAEYEPLQSPNPAEMWGLNKVLSAEKKESDGAEDVVDRQSNVISTTRGTLNKSSFHNHPIKNSKSGAHKAWLGCGADSNAQHSHRLLSSSGSSSDSLEGRDTGPSMHGAPSSAFQDL
jgi:hypothetical protein